VSFETLYKKKKTGNRVVGIVQWVQSPACTHTHTLALTHACAHTHTHLPGNTQRSWLSKMGQNPEDLHKPLPEILI
jgi:hypothetical protein